MKQYVVCGYAAMFATLLGCKSSQNSASTSSGIGGASGSTTSMTSASTGGGSTGGSSTGGGSITTGNGGVTESSMTTSSSMGGSSVGGGTGGQSEPCAGYFPSDAIWCMPVDKQGLMPDSAAATAMAGNWGSSSFQMDRSIVLTTVDAMNPGSLHSFFPTGDSYDPDCDLTPVMLPLSMDSSNGSLEGESGWDCKLDGDCHAIVMDTLSGFLYEQWRVMNAGTSNPYDGGCLRRWQPSVTHSTLPSDVQCSSADGSGQPMWPLVLTPEDVASGVIGHAIRFTLLNEQLRQKQFMPPATHSSGATSAAAPALPYGAWLRLSWSDAKIDTWVAANGNNPNVATILRGLKQHGMIVSDGGHIPLTFANDANRTIKWSDLGINEQSLMGNPPIVPMDFDWIIPPGYDVPPALTTENYNCQRTQLQ